MSTIRQKNVSKISEQCSITATLIINQVMLVHTNAIRGPWYRNGKIVALRLLAKNEIHS